MTTATNIRIVDSASLLAQRAQGEQVEHIPYRLTLGEQVINGRARKRIVNGEMEVIRINRPMGELMVTPAGLEAIVQKTILDLEQGREQVPLLYPPIYRRRENRGFTQDVRVKTSSGRARAVFLRHLEGEEIRFGDRVFGAEDTVPILVYATGFQWTEEMEEFDLSWEAEEANRAFGEAYNALLNHLHIFPLIDPAHVYPAKNRTAAQQDPEVAAPGAGYRNDRFTIKKALEHAALDKNPDTGRVRQPTIILAHPTNRFRVQEALQSAVIGGTQLPAVGQQLTTIILYEGWKETVGETKHEYPGVPTNKIYLIDPQRYFHELVKHDLRIDAGGPDITRLIKEATIARTYRGVYAVPDNGVEEVTLPA